MIKTYILLCTVNCVVLYNEMKQHFPISINRIQTSRMKLLLFESFIFDLKEERSLYIQT
jgi:hypothetical protein